MFQTVTVLNPTHCTEIVLYVMRQPASAHASQELVDGDVTGAMRMPTTRAEDVLVSVQRN